MSVGKKASVKAPAINAPPQVTQYDFLSPTGDRYTSRRENNFEINESFLTPQTRQTIGTSLDALDNLASELHMPDVRRVNQINQRGLDFYNLQAQGINAEADQIFGKAASDLSKRFGGTYNATFGTDYLSRLENNRLSNLSNAGKEAMLLAEDLYLQDEDSRSRRFGLFNNYLTNEFNKAQSLAGLGGNVLGNEASRAQSLAVNRAQLALNAAHYNQQAALQARQQTLNFYGGIAKSVIGASTAFAPK